MISSEQIRAARALIRWEQRNLAEASGVSLPSIKRLEGQPGDLAAQARTIDAIRHALESAGVIFVEENGEGPGVRLRKQSGIKSDLQTSHDEAVRREEANMAGVDAQDLRQKKRRPKR